jgi:hypothetical protein
MTRKHLSWQVVTAAAVLVAFNLMVRWAATNSIPRQILKKIESSSEANCLFSGNSLMVAGCDPMAFVAAWPPATPTPQPLNAGLGFSSPVEQWLLVDYALHHLAHVDYLIYGFFNTQLTEPMTHGWRDLVGNRAIAYSFPESAAAFYAPGSRLEVWRLRAVAAFPMVVNRVAVWAKVELLRRWLGELGLPKAKTNRFGRVADFNAFEAANAAGFAEQCAWAASHDQAFDAPIEAILRRPREHGASVFLVEMPMPTRHREKFYSTAAWQQYRAHLQRLASEVGAIYVPAADWVEDAGHFDDFLHLNPQGAQIFSAQLARFIAGRSPDASAETSRQKPR